MWIAAGKTLKRRVQNRYVVANEQIITHPACFESANRMDGRHRLAPIVEQLMTILNTRQAAEYVTLSKSSLDKMRMYGTGPSYFKLGGAVRYHRDDLDAWLATQRRASTWSNDNTVASAGAA